MMTTTEAMTVPALNLTLSARAARALEEVYRSHKGECAPVDVAFEAMIELHNAGLIYAPKGYAGAVRCTDRALDAFTLEGVTDPGEPRNAFEGVFAPV